MNYSEQIKTGRIDVIEWTDDAPGVMAWRFPLPNPEIRYGTKLHVHEFQLALFHFNGHTADIFKPGIYTLTIDNIPKLHFMGPRKTEPVQTFATDIFFVKTKYFLDEKWVLEKPLTFRDPTYGILRVNSSGTFDIRIVSPEKIVSKISGRQESFNTAEAAYMVGNKMQNFLPDALKQMNLSVVEPDNDYQALAAFIQESINTDLYSSGMMIENLKIRTNTLKPEN